MHPQIVQITVIPSWWRDRQCVCVSQLDFLSLQLTPKHVVQQLAPSSDHNSISKTINYMVWEVFSLHL